MVALALGLQSERLDHALGLTALLIVIGHSLVGHVPDEDRPVTHAQQYEVMLIRANNEPWAEPQQVIQTEAVSPTGIAVEMNRGNVANAEARGRSPECEPSE
jgi:hypothetical protein